MLQRFRFHLRFDGPIELYGNGAEPAHGLLFHQLRNLNPDFATRLHSAVEKPFAIGPIEGARRTFQPDETASFTIGALTSPLIEAIQALTPGPVRLLQSPATLTAIEPIDHEPRSYESLFDYRTRPRQIALRLKTPTSFRRQGEQLLLPEASLLFGSLLARFNQFSPFPFPPESRDELARLRVSRFEIRSSVLDFDSYKLLGTTGRITYTLPPDFPPQMSYLAAALARFGEFAGVGYKTTMGMGQVELIEEVNR